MSLWLSFWHPKRSHSLSHELFSTFIKNNSLQQQHNQQQFSSLCSFLFILIIDHFGVLNRHQNLLVCAFLFIQASCIWIHDKFGFLCSRFLKKEYLIPYPFFLPLEFIWHNDEIEDESYGFFPTFLSFQFCVLCERERLFNLFELIHNKVVIFLANSPLFCLFVFIIISSIWKWNSLFEIHFSTHRHRHQ